MKPPKSKLDKLYININTTIICLTIIMMHRRKKTQQPHDPYQHAKDIGKVMQFESRLFKTLENGVVCHSSDSSPDVSPEKISVLQIQNPKLKTGFESGYLGDSRNVQESSSKYGSDVENKAYHVRQRRTPVLKRSNSLTLLSPVPEEHESAFLQPHYVPVRPSLESDKKENNFSRKLKFFDVRNLRLSFRRKEKTKDTKSAFIPNVNPVGSEMIQSVHRPTTVSYENNCYFERHVTNCVECLKLLKDPRYCECPPKQLGSSQASSTLARRGSSRHSLPKVPLTSEQNGDLQRSIQIYGTVKRREKKRNQDVTAEIRKSLARFSVTPSFVEDYSSSTSLNKTNNENYYPTISRPTESRLSLVKTLKLDFMENRWICDITVTKKNDFVITDLKNAYLVTRDGNLKLTIGAKGFNRLHAPNSVTCDNVGNLIVSDQSTQRIQIYGLKGQHLNTLEDSNITAKSRIACNEKHHVLVTSTDKRKIIAHSQSNQHLYSISSSVQTNGGDVNNLNFYQPFSIAINHLTGDIIIGDDHKEMVIAMTSYGKPKWSFTPPGERTRSFLPNSICTDNNGYIFVADLYNEKIYMLDSSGKYLKTLLSRQNGLKGGPVAIATDAIGHLLVADEEKTLKLFKYGEKGFALHRRFSYVPQNL